MLITIVCAAILASFIVFAALVAACMLSSQISQEEEQREIVVNKQLAFANQVIVDAEFEESNDRISVEPYSSGIVLVRPTAVAPVRAAAVGHRKIDLYV